MEIDGEIMMTTTNHRLYGRCMECGKKSSTMCSDYIDKDGESSDGGKRRMSSLCDTTMGRPCWVTHFSKFHQHEHRDYFPQHLDNSH